MLRNLGTLVLALLLAAPLALAQNTGKLAGRVTDDAGDPLPGASVIIQDTQLGTATDLDGNYFIIGVPVGEYTITASFVGFQSQSIEGIRVSSGYTTEQNFTLSEGQELGTIVVEYERPIIQRDAIGVPKVVTGEEIENLPVRGVASVAAIQSGVVANEGSDDLFIRGGREQEVAYYVDGVKVTAGASVAVGQQAIAEQEMLIGTIPARYGDAQGGIISITTKSGGSRFFGSVEAITSEVLDAYGYNLASLTLGGPIYGDVASFFVSVSGSLQADESPYGIKTRRLSDASLERVRANPQSLRATNPTNGEITYVPLPTNIPEGTAVSDVVTNPGNYGISVPGGFVLDNSGALFSTSEIATPDRFEYTSVAAKENPYQDITFNGNVTLTPIEAMSLRLGGAFEMSDEETFNFLRFPYAPERFYNDERQTWRGYATFRQRLSDAAFYQIQAEYQDYRNWYYPNGYSRDVEDIFFYYDADSDNVATEIANRYYETQGGVFNRRGDGSIGTGAGYGIFSNPGAQLPQYQKTHNTQLRFTGSATAQLGLHQLEFGAEFEQRTRRYFRINSQTLTRYFNDGECESPTGTCYDDYSQLPYQALASQGAYLYYGYSYNGLEEVDDQNIQAFIDADESSTANNAAFNVAPYKPIYYAGYIQDKIEYRDLIVNLGLRVDVFDNNTPALRDDYSPYRIIRVNDITNAEGDYYRADVVPNLPGNIGEDYAVYFAGGASGQVVGYRDVDGRFFDANGRRVNDPRDIARLGTVVNIGNGNQVDPSQFEDYEPQVTFMPRIGVSFPVTDRALFFASYNVTSQRPTEAAFAPFTDYNALTSGTRPSGNPGLEPETTTQYELGFRQRVGERAAITLSGFYRTQDNKIQVINLQGGAPAYYAFQNFDFTTTKGVEFEFDLRRTNNVSLNANYTLSFAQGTGSDATSAQAIAWKGGYLPNFISPADFDRRHTLNVSLDYRLGEGEGPELFGARPLANFGINLLGSFKSGQPYTRTVRPLAIFSDFGADRPAGAVNDTELPSSTLLNLKVDRSFDMGFANLKAYLVVLNLLDTDTILNVYRATGQVDNDGFLATPLGQDAISGAADSEGFLFNYNLAQTGPLNITSGGYGASGAANDLLYGLPRRIRLGVLIDF